MTLKDASGPLFSGYFRRPDHIATHNAARFAASTAANADIHGPAPRIIKDKAPARSPTIKPTSKDPTGMPGFQHGMQRNARIKLLGLIRS